MGHDGGGRFRSRASGPEHPAEGAADACPLRRAGAQVVPEDPSQRGGCLVVLRSASRSPKGRKGPAPDQIAELSAAVCPVGEAEQVGQALEGEAMIVGEQDLRDPILGRQAAEQVCDPIDGMAGLGRGEFEEDQSRDWSAASSSRPSTGTFRRWNRACPASCRKTWATGPAIASRCVAPGRAGSAGARACTSRMYS